MARLLLRLGLPMAGGVDEPAQEPQRRSLAIYWTGRAGEQPQTLFQSVLPFLRPEQPSANPGPESEPPPIQPEESGPEPTPPPPETPAKPDPVVVKKGQPLVGIYHTHDWESYISEFPGLTPKSPADLNEIRSEDHKKRTVMELGNKLAIALKERGVTTVWANYTHKDYDSAYASSRNTAQQILKSAPTVKVLVDLHRDAAWGAETVTEIDGQKVAKIRCIIGRQQPHWQQNRGFCDQLMSRLDKKYPGVVLPTRDQNDGYNQDLLPGAILLEIGDAMNRYDEAERSIRYLADALAEAVLEGAYPK